MNEGNSGAWSLPGVWGWRVDRGCGFNRRLNPAHRHRPTPRHSERAGRAGNRLLENSLIRGLVIDNWEIN